MTLRVPTNKVESIGMRKLSSDKTLKEAMETLKGKPKVKRTMWSRRAQEYEAKINSGDPISIAEVVRDLHRKVDQPDQSFSERQIYEAALDRLVREFAAVEKIDREKAAEKVFSELGRLRAFKQERAEDGGEMLLAVAGSVSAQSFKAGTSGAQFLKIGVGARALGMGGAFASIADDATAAFTNPAGLTTLSKAEISFEGRQWDYTNTFTDTGFGSRANSPDAMLFFHVVAPDFVPNELVGVVLHGGGGAQRALALDVDGVGGSVWRSDVGLLNRSTLPNRVRLRYLNGDGFDDLELELEPGEYRTVGDVVGDLGHEGAGPLRAFSAEPLTVTSRTFNQAASGSTRTATITAAMRAKVLVNASGANRRRSTNAA